MREPARKPSRYQVNWNDATIATLKADWAAGLSCSQIARNIGGGCTRNAVIGKASRMKLTPRGSPLGIYRRTSVNPPKPRPRRPKPSLVAMAAPAARVPMALQIWSGREPRGAGEAVLALKPHGECRWPFSGPNKPDFHFCCRPIDLQSVYCEEHARIAYTPLVARPKIKRTLEERIWSGG